MCEFVGRPTAPGYLFALCEVAGVRVIAGAGGGQGVLGPGWYGLQWVHPSGRIERMLGAGRETLTKLVEAHGERFGWLAEAVAGLPEDASDIPGLLGARASLEEMVGYWPRSVVPDFGRPDRLRGLTGCGMPLPAAGAPVGGQVAPREG